MLDRFVQEGQRDHSLDGGVSFPARRKLDQLNRVRDLRELAVPPGNRLEALRGKGAGEFSIQINDQYRICFHWESGYAQQVEIVDYH